MERKCDEWTIRAWINRSSSVIFFAPHFLLKNRISKEQGKCARENKRSETKLFHFHSLFSLHLYFPSCFYFVRSPPETDESLKEIWKKNNPRANEIRGSCEGRENSSRRYFVLSSLSRDIRLLRFWYPQHRDAVTRSVKAKHGAACNPRTLDFIFSIANGTTGSTITLWNYSYNDARAIFIGRTKGGGRK